MTATVIKHSQAHTGQAIDEREEISDGRIVVSHNPLRPNGEVCWRRCDADDDWHDLPYVSTDLPGGAEQIIAFVHDYLELNEYDD